MSDQPQVVRNASVVDAIVEAQIVNFHGETEDGLQPPRITRQQVEDELSLDLLDAALRGSL